MENFKGGLFYHNHLAVLNAGVHQQMAQFHIKMCSTLKKLDGMRLGNQMP